MKEQTKSKSDQFLHTEGGKSKSNAIEVPSISLPKGGGAIKGIDEKFSVNAVNGTASFNIPLPVSQARGAIPSLSLSYSSGAGNSPFGLGWSLSLGSIKRKTEQGLPQYLDSVNSDTFLFSESEDLVPEFKRSEDGSFDLEEDEYVIYERNSPDNLFSIRFYRPRIEGLFARIERWTAKDNSETKWKVTTRDNSTTLFGWTSNARISKPGDDATIFEWFPEFVFDDKGNCSHYIYKKEDSKGFNASFVHNCNRLKDGVITYTNAYISKVLYGNKTPYSPADAGFPAEDSFLFATVFDYGEYNSVAPFNEIKDWDFRQDAFSDYKAGFEIRTTRLCKRVLLFHHFSGENEYEGLVRSINFEYSTDVEDFTFLKSVRSHGYIRNISGDYSEKKLPPVTFEYQAHHWNKEVRTIDAADTMHAPTGIDEQQYLFTDLYNEGLSGILTEQANGWYYKDNLGDGHFGNAKLVNPKPSFTGLGSVMQLSDLEGDGGRQLVCYNREPAGFFELNDLNEWQQFRAFKSLPNIDFSGPDTRMLDLNGDGKPEVVISEDSVFTWYASDGKDGFLEVRKSPQSHDEESSPHIVFSDATQSIFLADMSGDGLTDIVRIRNKDVCYWPNLGYGKFGAKVAFDSAPVFDHPDGFNPSWIRLADIDGSGTTDIVYFGQSKFSCWKNLSGNGFSTSPFEIESFPDVHTHSKVSVADLLGNGVACIVWSGGLEKDGHAPLRYIDLMNGRKPHIMIGYKNNLGKEVALEYRASTRFYLDDKAAGRPWVTKLHFPVHCISKTITEDKVSGHRFVSEFKYHHGYYDHLEKEFRGFGMVEQTDSETFEHWIKSGASNIVEEALHQEPVVSKTWHHTGAFFNKEEILNQFKEDYWYAIRDREGFPVAHHEVALADARLVTAPEIDSSILDDLSVQEWQQASRACKGMTLRSEVFAKDAVGNGNTSAAIEQELTPFSVNTHNCIIELIQPKGRNKHAVFVVRESEAITYNYERNPEDPRISHNLNIRLDKYGNVLESAAVVYPRKIADLQLPQGTCDEQSKTLILYTENRFTNDVVNEDSYRLRLPSEVKTYELKGVEKPLPFYTPDDFENILTDAESNVALYHELEKPLSIGKAQRRLVEHVRSVFYKDDLTGALPLHTLHALALPFERYQLAYSPELAADIFGTKVDSTLFAEGKFTHCEGDDQWWVRSGSVQFIQDAETAAAARSRFFKPLSYTDPFGALTKVKYYGSYFLFIEETENALGNKSRVQRFNFRTLTPQRMQDINGNVSESISDELGMIKATALMGKGNQADELIGIKEETDAVEQTAIQDFLNASESTVVTSTGKSLLQHATSRFVYDIDSYQNSGKPVSAAAITRETHYRKPDGSLNPESKVQIAFEYSSGLGEVIMKKVQAEPGKAKQVTVNPDNSIVVISVDTAASNPKQLRWIGNGRSIKNNKGKVVKQYEPYFSVTHHYENFKELVETGVTPEFYYDAAGRLIKTKQPDGTFMSVAFDAWRQVVYDANDTVLESEWYLNRINHLIDAKLTSEGKDPQREKEAADRAAKHANTPDVLHFDSLGRPVLFVEHNKTIGGADEFYQTRITTDAEGNLRTVTDARALLLMKYKYDMLGNKVYQKSMDSGQRWLFQDILGAPLRTWDERDHEFRYFYDILHRPTHSTILGGDGDTPLEHVFDRLIYGESLLAPDRSNENALQNRNVLGQPLQHFDTGGLIETPDYDFRGKPLATTRKLFKKYKEVANWIDANLISDLEADSFLFTTETDALGRIFRQEAPDGSVITPSYNEAGFLNLEQVLHPGAVAEVTYIKDIDYNEKGQRERIVYGNDVATKFFYDRETFRVNRLESKRLNNELLQDLNYTYDPSGNITHVQDNAIAAEFYSNMQILPANEYTYDALYRLIHATGREDASVLNFGDCDNWNDRPFIRMMNPAALIGMRNYSEEYKYDPVGNIQQMKHIALGGNWTRDYTYEATNNRLQSTQIGDNGNPASYTKYQHHAAHGFLEELPHLEKIGYNFKEEIVLTSRQHCTDDNIPVITYYQYDGQGKRLRKITENQAAGNGVPTKKDERIYIAGYELYRKHSGAAAGLERVSLSLMEEGHRFVTIETRNDISDGTEQQLTRYQLHSLLGSACLELDGNAAVISYEEYHPFGTTAYQATNASINPAAKRYRYTGMERDEETGLEYHNARYYVPWLGRWLNADPIGFDDGVNVYAYCKGNPVNCSDRKGTQVEERPAVSVTPLVTDVSGVNASGSFTINNMFSANRSVSGSGVLNGQLRSSFMLQVPALSIDTTGIANVTGTAIFDTDLGRASARLQGNVLVGDTAGLNLTAFGGGYVSVPLPGSVTMSSLPGSLLNNAATTATANLNLHGDFSSGNFSILNYKLQASLNAGQFEGRLDATTVGNIGKVHVDASGGVTPGSNVQANASVSLPGVGLNVHAEGTVNADGAGVSGNVSGDLKLLGLQSLRFQGTGSVTGSDASLTGTFSGAGPLYTSYIRGNFDLSTQRGISANAGIFGLTYSPSVTVTDPTPPTPGILATMGSPKEPWTPGGLTVGASFFQYSQGNLNYVSAGFMPDIGENIISNPRVGVTSQWHF